MNSRQQAKDWVIFLEIKEEKKTFQMCNKAPVSMTERQKSFSRSKFLCAVLFYIAWQKVVFARITVTYYRDIKCKRLK